MGWRHRLASLLRATVSLSPPISSPPHRRAAGGCERLPGPRWRPWSAAAALTTRQGWCRRIRYKTQCASDNALPTVMN